MLKLIIDLLPDDDLLGLTLEHKQTSLPIEKQKELTLLILDNVKNDKHEQDKILQCKPFLFLSH
jgi:hypothetical protein